MISANTVTVMLKTEIHLKTHQGFLAQTVKPDVPAGVFSKLENWASSSFSASEALKDMKINKIEIKISLPLTIMRMEIKLNCQRSFFKVSQMDHLCQGPGETVAETVDQAAARAAAARATTP
jgi:hypothetical protein